MLSSLLGATRLWWEGCRGFRLRPWRSPYLRWRVETYSGKPAASLRLRDFFLLLLAERAQILHYLRWLGEVRGLAAERKP